MSWNFGDPGRARRCSASRTRWGSASRSSCSPSGSAGRRARSAFLRRHIRAVNIIGGVLLIVLGVLMVTGVWTALMAQLQGVFLSVPLPL